MAVPFEYLFIDFHILAENDNGGIEGCVMAMPAQINTRYINVYMHS